MKKIRVYFVLGLLFGLFACNNLLDVTPENSVTFENFYKTEKDMQAALDAIRSEFRGTLAFDAYSRPVSVGYVCDTTESIKEFNWDISRWGPQWVDFAWSGQYTLVSLANIMLERIGGANIPEARKRFYIGQAHFYRAFVYYRIAQKWGEAPLKTNSMTIEKLGKVSNPELLQFALDEINLALPDIPERKDLLDVDGKPITSKSMACRAVAQALKLEICLWKAALNNQPDLLDDAIRAASYVIDSCDYVLAANPEEVCTKVINGGTDEGIFEIKYNYIETGTNPWTTMRYLVTYPIKPEDEMGSVKSQDARIYQKTVDKMFPGQFEGPVAEGHFTGDRRRLAYFYNLDTIRLNQEWAEKAAGFAYPYKFRKIQKGTQSYNEGRFECFASDHVVWRLADIILLRAEAYARQGESSKAIADLNRIRERAYGDDSGNYEASEGDLRYAIFKEREKELLWEGKRWWDVVRNNYWKTELWEFHRTKLTQADVDNGALYVPVFLDAFNQNPLMSQNKYWQSRY